MNLELNLSKSLSEHQLVFSDLISCKEKIFQMYEEVINTLESGKTILVCGNGGSAADSQHFASELSGRFKNDRIPLSAIALTTDSSALTCIGNDYGYEQVFSRQLDAIGKKGDLIILITTSGNSQNLVLAANKAKEKGILTIAVVTKPFDFEGKKRMETALIGLEKLENSVDTLIVIPNQNLFRIANDKTTFSEAFQLADDVLYQGIIGITDLITSPGMINLDFSDIKTVMKNKGQAMMGTGEHSGENRAKIAAEMALNNPLLDNSSIDGASSILLNIKGGLDLALFEVDEAASLIRAKVNENANIIFGSSIDESLDGIINVSVVATGININQSIKSEEVIDRNINQSELSEIDDDSSKIEGQIDLESKIADLNKISDSEKTTAEPEKDSLTFLETKEKELSDIFNKKNDVTENVTEENQFLKKISNLFSNNKNKNILEKLEKDNEVFPLKDVVENEKNDEEKPLINLNENPIKSENNNEQISLLDIDENEKRDNLDDVLEIPAFLRRQAN